jgi:hypothetical protein
MTKSNILLALAALASVAGISTSASASTRWNHHHPRQHEVLAREHHQLHRIGREERRGVISHREARAERRADRAIAAQERADARYHGGHISRAEKHQLNRELNRQNRHIG